MRPDDYLFHSTLFARYNPNNAPVTQDLAVRRVPLSQIKPELLEKEGKLTEAFCAGVWSGLGTFFFVFYPYARPQYVLFDLHHHARHHQSGNTTRRNSDYRLLCT